MQDVRLQRAEEAMQKALQAYQNELTKMRTGRAHAGLVDSVKVDYYGNETPLKNVANVVVSDARTLVITPWEKTLVKPIEKAIQNANLGLNPIAEANLVRIPIPPLTEERRREMVKVVKNIAETARVTTRNLRRTALDEIKQAVKAKELSEDGERRLQDEVQKLTDSYIAKIDDVAAKKEVELMQI